MCSFCLHFAGCSVLSLSWGRLEQLMSDLRKISKVKRVMAAAFETVLKLAVICIKNDVWLWGCVAFYPPTQLRISVVAIISYKLDSTKFAIHRRIMLLSGDHVMKPFYHAAAILHHEWLHFMKDKIHTKSIVVYWWFGLVTLYKLKLSPAGFSVEIDHVKFFPSIWIWPNRVCFFGLLRAKYSKFDKIWLEKVMEIAPGNFMKSLKLLFYQT